VHDVLDGQPLGRTEVSAVRVRGRDDRGGVFAAILYTVVTGGSIVSALTNIIARALNINA
jgi:Protein of unknown function (DUF4244)